MNKYITYVSLTFPVQHDGKITKETIMDGLASKLANLVTQDYNMYDEFDICGSFMQDDDVAIDKP